MLTCIEAILSKAYLKQAIIATPCENGNACPHYITVLS